MPLKRRNDGGHAHDDQLPVLSPGLTQLRQSAEAVLHHVRVVRVILQRVV